jgi:type II secretory pathway component PulF
MAQQTFAYTALDAAGSRKSGLVEADTSDAAVARLANEGRFVLDIKTVAATANLMEPDEANTRPPSSQDMALFTRRLADLALAGLPLDRVLKVVAQQSESGVLKGICEEALVDVSSGLPISQALGKHPKYFDSIFVQTLRAGEASGQFGEVASRLADYQEKDVARRGQITSALVYPVLLAAVAVGVITFLMTFVLPRMSGVFKAMGNDLPITTVMLMAASNFMTQHWLVILIAIAVIYFGLRAWFNTPGGAEAKDRFLITAPVIGPVVLKATISRFARVLGTLIFGGVPILEALDIAGLSANNQVFLKGARIVEEEVRAGRPIADAMEEAGGFPPVLTNMIAVGEETGDLPKMLSRVADSLDFEVDTGMRRIISLLEPVIVLVMGAIVGFVIVSILLPIYQAQNLVK